MNPINYVQDMVTRFRAVLNAHDSQLKCFCHYGVQVEGWLKGELLYFLDAEKTSGRLVDFEREALCGIDKKKVDLRLDITTGSTPSNAWIELKHWLIGYQKGELWKAHNYFGDATIGVQPDVEKLSKIIRGDKYIFILATSNPGHEDWTKGVDKFNNKFSPLSLRSLTQPSDFPDSYFFGVLEVIS